MSSASSCFSSFQNIAETCPAPMVGTDMFDRVPPDRPGNRGIAAPGDFFGAPPTLKA
jgi:hypothetical protein